MFAGCLLIAHASTIRPQDPFRMTKEEMGYVCMCVYVNVYIHLILNVVNRTTTSGTRRIV
jgi:3,4-dihydroxy-2-butanone 4-phosphate synthase